MKIDRLIGDYPEDIASYEDFSEKDFKVAFSYFNAIGPSTIQTQVTACVLAHFLKQNNLWLGDRFFFGFNVYTIRNLTTTYEFTPGLKINFEFVSKQTRPTFHGERIHSPTNETCEADFDQVSLIPRESL